MKAFVLTCLLAAVTASAVVPTPYHYAAYPFGISSYSYANSLLLPHALSPVSPFVVAPAAVVPGHHVPADTPEVAAAKIAHFAAHAEARSRGKRAAAYYGPPAPLNRDGTVAFTPEIQQANAVHTAAYQQEFQRLQSAASLAAAHPDRTSPPSPDYNPSNNGQYNQQSYDNGQYNPAWNNPTPSYNSAPAYNPTPAPAWNNPAPAWNNPAPSYNPTPSYNPAPSYNQGSYNPQPPAPLNADGTAAYTREYQAIAQSHQQAYHQALSRTKRSVHLNPDGTVAPTPEVAAATAAHFAALHGAAATTGVYHHGAGAYGAYAPYTYGHAYYHGAAPLNPDGTVAETPEVRAAAAVHASYVAKQFSDLAHQEALAVSAGPGEGEGAYYAGHYAAPYAGHYAAPYAGHYAGHYAGYYPAAPLNADGTVAPTPEVAAATAAHLAAHAHARLGHHY